MNYFSQPNSNVARLAEQEGTVVGAYKYAPYGKTAVYGGTVAQNNTLRWLGAQQNTTDETSHYKLGARYYDYQGHFTQPDSLAGGIGDPRTMTSYNYAGGDPINNADVSGKSLGSIVGGLVGTGIAIGGTAVSCAASVGTLCVAGGFASAGVGAVIATGVETSIDGSSPAESRESLANNLFGGFVGAFLAPFGGPQVAKFLGL